MWFLQTLTLNNVHAERIRVMEYSGGSKSLPFCLPAIFWFLHNFTEVLSTFLPATDPTSLFLRISLLYFSFTLRSPICIFFPLSLSNSYLHLYILYQTSLPPISTFPHFSIFDFSSHTSMLLSFPHFCFRLLPLFPF